MDFGEIRKKLAETEPTKLDRIPTEQLIEYEQYFSGQLLSFGFDQQHQQYQQQCRSRMDSLRREIQHRQAYGVGKKTLSWARIAGVAAIATVVVSVAALICSIYFAKLQPATSEPVQLTTSHQRPAPTAAFQEPEASSSSATPSLQRAATAQPSVSPPESLN